MSLQVADYIHIDFTILVMLFAVIHTSLIKIRKVMAIACICYAISGVIRAYYVQTDLVWSLSVHILSIAILVFWLWDLSKKKPNLNNEKGVKHAEKKG